MKDINQTKELEILKKAIKQKRLAHAYLFIGKDSSEKEALIKKSAKLLMCSNPDNNLHLIPCNACIHCKKIESKNHPDYMEVFPDGNFIKIEQIRSVQEKLKFPPLESKRRVCIIFNAHKLNPSAANALLKTLEEPPANTYFLLSAKSRGSLLPTIVSRCQIIRIEQNEILQNTKIENKIYAYDSNLVETVSLEKIKILVEKIFVFLSSSEKRLHYFECMKEASQSRETAKIFVIIFIFILRDLLLIKSLPSLKHDYLNENNLFLCHEFSHSLLKLAQELNYDTLKSLEKRLKEAEIFFNRNVKTEMIIDRVLLYMMKNLKSLSYEQL